MVTNNYFKIYLSQVFALAETLVIKSEASVFGINKRIQALRGENAVDLSRPETWKYYLNVAGEYHPEDERMVVTSLDTLERIDFTKENLKIHRATARAYQYGNRLFKELMTRFPKQELLILGILYPVDIDQAIAAKDGTILGYPQHLVEFNEYSFIERLQSWIYKYRKQNYNPQYSVSDDLFESVLLGQFYMHLVPAILNIRLRACRTNEAHSYHVRTYLASHGILNEYLDHLTVEQSLWCYRNINYLERYAGHQDTFEWLVENILTKRGIPLSEYSMKHDTTHQPNSVTPFDLEKLKDGSAYYPTIRFKKNNINATSETETIYHTSLSELFDKEDGIAFDNPRFKVDDLSVAKVKMENSLSNSLLTKALESSMHDYSDSQAYSLSDVLLNQWIQRAFDGTYVAVITVSHPRTGELISLRAKEALYLLYYLVSVKDRRPYLKLPTLIAGRTVRKPTPSKEDLLKHVPEGVISDNAYETALAVMPTVGIAHSVDTFYEESVQYWEAMNLQNTLISQYEHDLERSYAENFITRLYATVAYPPERDVEYKHWLTEIGLNVADLEHDEEAILFDSILNTGTGTTLRNNVNIRSLQRAMLKLMTQLSSYSIQFLSEINSSDIKQLDLNRIRVGDRDSRIETLIHLTELEVEVLEVDTHPVQEVDFNPNPVDREDTTDTEVHASVDYVLPTIFDTEGHEVRYELTVDLPRLTIDYTSPITWPNAAGLLPIWRTQDLLGLTPEQLNEIVNVGSHDYGCTDRPSDVSQVNSNFQSQGLNGFNPITTPIGSVLSTNVSNSYSSLTTPIQTGLKTNLLDSYRQVTTPIGSLFPSPHLPGYPDLKPPLAAILTPLVPGFQQTQKHELTDVTHPDYTVQSTNDLVVVQTERTVKIKGF